MSFALQEINIPALAVNDGTDFTFTNATMRNDAWTEQDPAYMRMVNATGRGFLVGMKTGGDTFWLRPGEGIMFPLAVNEVGFSIICKYIDANITASDLFLLTYFSNRQAVFDWQDLSNPSQASSSDYPSGANPFSSSSGNKANATATATISAAAGLTNFLTGFEVTGSGATAALVVVVTVTGLNGGTLSYPYSAAAGVAVENTPLIVEFSKPLPASAPNTAISVSCPALGAGNTNNAVNVHGYQL